MSDESSVASEVARLYAADLGSFVAERTALSKAWKKAGRRDDAAVIAALRKPSVVEHGLNLVANAAPDVVRAWAEAVRTADAAQSAAIGGADARDLRAAMGDVRTATAAVVDATVGALGGDEAKRGDVLALLRNLATGSIEQVVAGVVGSASPVVEELFAGAPEPAARPPRPPKPAKVSKPEPEPEPAPPPPPPPTRNADVGRQERLVAKRALADEAVDVAQRVVDAARADVARAEQELREAEVALRRARASRAKLD